MAATFDVELSSTGTRDSVFEQKQLGEQAMADLHVPAPALFVGRRFGMDSDYKLGLVEINLGLNPAMGGTQRLPRLIGRSKSIRMITTGETISPKLAFTWGIFDWLEDKKDFDSKVMQYAEKLAEGPTVAQGFAKQSIIKGLEMSLAEGTALERSNQQILMATDDAGEGLDAFLSKRQPKFKGS